MFSHFKGLLATLVIGWTSAAALGGPRLIFPNDPAGKSIRAAAARFCVKIVAGDRQGAAALFDGPADDARLMDAEIAFVTASDALAKSIHAHFPNADPQLSQRIGRTLFEHAGDRMLQEFLVVNGDSASTTSEIPFEVEIGLQRGSAGWRVVHFGSNPREAKILFHFFGGLARGIDAVRAKIDAGQTADAASATADLKRQTNPLYSELGSELSTDYTKPTTRPSDPRPTAAPDALLAWRCIGKHINAPEIAAVVASMPATPHLSIAGPLVYLASVDAGFTLCFNAQDGALKTIQLFPQGQDGFDQYRGPLPFGLRFGEPRGEVEAKLGRPSRVEPGSATFGQRGVIITYASSAPRDPNNPVVQITLTVPRPDQTPIPLPHGKPPWLTFRLVVAEGSPQSANAESVADPDDPSGKSRMLLSRTPILDENSVLDASPVQPWMNERNEWRLDLMMTPQGGRRLKQISSANIGRRIAIVFDGRVLVAPVIRSPLADAIEIDSGSKDDGQHFEALARQINAVICSLPVSATQPASDRAPR